MLEDLVDKLIGEILSYGELQMMQSNQLKLFTVRASYYSKAITFLNKKIVDYQFQSLEEEISFFRKSKPKLLAEHHYNCVQAKFHKKCQHISSDARVEYINQEIGRLDNFFMANQDFLSYMSMERHDLDSVYFVRLNIRNVDDLECNMLDKDLRTTSEMSHLVAKLISNKRLSIYFHKLINKDSILDIDSTLQPSGKLKWKGTQTDFVELIYALHASGSTDGSLTKTAEILGQAFGLERIDIYKKWHRIKERKLDPVRLISQLHQNLSKLIQDENSKP